MARFYKFSIFAIIVSKILSITLPPEFLRPHFSSLYWQGILNLLRRQTDITFSKFPPWFLLQQGYPTVSFFTDVTLIVRIFPRLPTADACCGKKIPATEANTNIAANTIAMILFLFIFFIIYLFPLSFVNKAQKNSELYYLKTTGFL